MILEAIGTILTPIVDNYPLVGDIEAAPPFAVFEVQQRPFITKAGINGYSNTVFITAVAIKIPALMALSQSIKNAVEAAAGNTINGTTILAARFREENQRFDEQYQVNINQLEFMIYTNNI